MIKMKTMINNPINRLANARHLILLAAFFLGMLATRAQEYLAPLHGNMHLMSQKAAAGQPSKKIQTAAFDTLPFFDDFHYAYKSPYPSADRWKDSNVYVNTGFPIAPISIGVATFDGLNKHGYPYNFLAPVITSASADTLTSRPINIETNPSGTITYDAAHDSLILSFYYQAEGNGDSPESNDSLCLEMLNRSTGHWVHMWGVKGYNPDATDTNFYYVAIPILDQGFLDTLFQFRFRNKATTSGSLDHWHIDNVFLGANRSLIQDTSRKDVVFAYPSESLLKNYCAMPYEQFNSTEMIDSTHTFLRDNFFGRVNVTYNYAIYDKTGAVQSQGAGSANAWPFKEKGYSDTAGIRGLTLNNYVFGNPPNSTTFPFADTTFYTYKSTLFNFNNILPADTLVQTQRFSNYYAYDDGAAEAAYYLNAQGARMAQRFTLNTKDTLRAMDIFFDPISYNSSLSHQFRISIWTDSGNGPSTTRLLQDSLMDPVYINWGYNSIPRYVLTSPLILNAGTYYFGIKQTDPAQLDIGFDKNNNHMKALYYDIGFGWTQSAIAGSLMMRPVFGRSSLVLTGVKEEQAAVQSHATLYPNPAQDKVYISTSHDTHTYSTAEVLSVMGQAMLSSRYDGAGTAIDISSLPNGVYFIYLSGRGASTTPQKLIISR